MKLLALIIIVLVSIIMVELVDRVIILEYPDLFWWTFGMITGATVTIIIMA
jgi:hypothetical protein